MARITNHKSRQVIVKSGGTLEDGLHIEELSLFDEEGRPVHLGGGYLRNTLIHNTSPLAPGEMSLSVVNLFPSWRLFKFATNRPARVRVYATSAQRQADLYRSIGTKPRGDHGRLFEMITSNLDLEYTLTPVVDLASDTSDADFFITVTNLDVVDGIVTSTFHYVRTE